MHARNKNLFTIHAATIRYLEIGHKNDVTAIAMETITIQDGGCFGITCTVYTIDIGDLDC